MTTFVALYRGRTVSEAELVAVSAEPRLVGKFIAELLQKHLEEREEPAKENRSTVIELAHREE